MTLSAAKILSHIHIQQLNNNEKGNLSGLMVPAGNSSMVLPQHRELILCVARLSDQDIIVTTGDWRLPKVRVYRVDLDRYDKQNVAWNSYRKRSSTAAKASNSFGPSSGYYLKRLLLKYLRTDRKEQ